MLVTKEILKEADTLIAGERHKDYGDKVKNHNNISKLWSAYKDIEITAHDVAVMMVLLKIARTKLGEISKDTYVDMSAYGAIAGEIKFNSINNNKEKNTPGHIKHMRNSTAPLKE
jgi:hypothetical protein